MQTIVVGGVEGGATHSNAVLLDGSGNEIVKTLGPGTNFHHIGLEEVQRRINDMINEAKEKAGIPLDTPIDALGLGLSGCEDQQVNSELVKGLMSSYPNLSKHYVIGSDTDGSVSAVSNRGGVVCIAGTGSNTLLINPDGSRAQCGGWGYLLADEGSAWKIAHTAIKLCFEHLDQFQHAPHPIERTWGEIKSFFKVETQSALLTYFYGAKFDKAHVAKLCHRLAHLAEDGDPLCVHIFRSAGIDLARGIAAVVRTASEELFEREGGLHVNCVGSVWLSWKLLQDGFIEYITDNTSIRKMSLIKLTKSSAVGAALMASDKLNIPIPRDYSSHFEVFFRYSRD